MSRECEPCRLHLPDPAPATCPQCGRPTKFTLLAPQNQRPDPLPDVPSRPTRGFNPETTPGYERGFFGPLTHHPAFKPGLAVAFVLAVISIFGAWLNQGDEFTRRAAKLKVGMPIAAAAAVMGDADPTGGTGEVVWEGGDKAVRVVYRDGVVTDLRPDIARGGLFARRVGR